MAFVVKENISFDPVQVAFLSMDRVMFKPQRITDLVEQFLGGLNVLIRTP
jgi:hypothetical protein